LAKFEPGPSSRTPIEEAQELLRYIRRATEIVEAEMLSCEEAPVYLLDRLHHAVAQTGMAVSFMKNRKGLTKLPLPKGKRVKGKMTKGKRRKRSPVVQAMLARAREEGGR